MEKEADRPTTGTTLIFGAILGVLTGVPVIVILYAGDQLAGLPFVPFTLFEFVSRILPGRLVIFAIEWMVSIITALNIGPIDEAGLMAEQLIALIQFLVLGAVLGMAISAFHRQGKSVRLPVVGLGIGLVLAVLLVLLESASGISGTGPVANLLWFGLVFAVWGLVLGALLRGVFRARVEEIFIQSADSFYESVTMEDIMDERTLLVYEMNGEPLPQENGFPLRLYVPNRYGMKLPKWITRIEARSTHRDGYWVERGWSREAIVHATSVIDNIILGEEEDTTILAGGIAQAGARGISKVEVQLDEQAWQEAELRTPPLSPLTWVQWRYETPVEPGRHVARVRAYDGDGQLQVVEGSGTFPDGATGIHEFNFSI